MVNDFNTSPGSFDFRALKEAGTIGLFDSGVGGLSVFKQLQGAYKINTSDKLSFRPDGKLLPNFLYVADTLRCPYGDRPAEEIRQYASEIAAWLKLRGAQALVLASNTLASVAAVAASQASGLPVFDLISPTAHFLSRLRHAKIAVLATTGTIKSQEFKKRIHEFNNQIEVTEIACPDLVPLIEQGKISGTEVETVLAKYVMQIKNSQAEAVVLGCTHFPFMKETLQHLLSDKVRLIDPASVLASYLIEVNPDFQENELTTSVQPHSFNSTFNFYVTGSVTNFITTASSICEMPTSIVQPLSLESLTSQQFMQAQAIIKKPQDQRLIF